MKTIVIYSSQTGFTKRYAQWIAKAADADCFSLSDAKKKDLSAYGAIIYGGWACAGSIHNIRWFKNHTARWTGQKKLIAFCVGASPADSPDIAAALEQNFNDPDLENMHLFYCPGGLSYNQMSASSRLMMKLFIKTLKAKKAPTPQEQEMIRMLSSSYDISDKKYIKPILQCLNQ